MDSGAPFFPPAAHSCRSLGRGTGNNKQKKKGEPKGTTTKDYRGKEAEWKKTGAAVHPPLSGVGAGTTKNHLLLSAMRIAAVRSNI